MAEVDPAHLRLSPGSYYVRIRFVRSMHKRKMLALVYLTELSTGITYSIGLSRRPDDRAAYRQILSVAEGSLFWICVSVTKNGYSRFETLELIAEGSIASAVLGPLAWDLASRGRVTMPLRIPFLWQRGETERPRIVIVWPDCDLECYPSDFAGPSTEFPSLLHDAAKRREFMRHYSRRPDRTRKFFDFMEGTPVSDINFETATRSEPAGVAYRNGDLAPFNVFHIFLSPVPAVGGIKKRRRGSIPIDTDSILSRIVLRILQPDLVVAVGTEVARRLPKILRPIPHAKPYKLPGLGKIPCGRMGVLDNVRQVFDPKWCADFIVAPDLKYFGAERIGGRKLADDFWGRFAQYLRDAISRNTPVKVGTYAKSTEEVERPSASLPPVPLPEAEMKALRAIFD